MQVGKPLISGLTMQSSYVNEETEILTQRGWITHRSLHRDEAILSLDPQSRDIQWVPLISVHRLEYDGLLTHWKSGRMDALTTPNTATAFA
jgi:hypothetical protein